MRIPNNKKYAVALSHDVDYPEIIYWIEILRNPTKDVKRILKENFWKFEENMQLERSYNMVSAFYFCATQGNLFRYFFGIPDPFYDIEARHFKEIIQYLDQCNFEIGLHASYLAHRSLEMFRQEKEKLEKVLGKPVYGNRHHYWKMNNDNIFETSQMHKEIGLLYDSSINYGYSGKCEPYQLCVLEIPVVLTDSQLFRYQKYDYRKEIDRTIELVRQKNGVLMVDFHVRVLNTFFFPEWADAYKYLLKKISEKDDFYCNTPLNIAKWWNENSNID